jgi:hypothetical protein
VCNTSCHHCQFLLVELFRNRRWGLDNVPLPYDSNDTVSLANRKTRDIDKQYPITKLTSLVWLALSNDVRTNKKAQGRYCTYIAVLRSVVLPDATHSSLQRFQVKNAYMEGLLQWESYHLSCTRGERSQ